MTQELVGYQLVRKSDSIILETWGGIPGQCPGVPNPLVLPNGDQVCGAGLGWENTSYRLDGIYMPPAIPQSVTKRQVIFWLISQSKSEQDVLNAIAAITDPTTRAQASAFWAYPDDGKIPRQHPMTITLGGALGLNTPALLDAAFTAASTL
jgi:hypothetical protein